MEIAKKNILAIEERGHMETVHGDWGDFFEVAIWELRDALNAAYELGKASK